VLLWDTTLSFTSDVMPATEKKASYRLRRAKISRRILESLMDPMEDSNGRTGTNQALLRIIRRKLPASLTE